MLVVLPLLLLFSALGFCARVGWTGPGGTLGFGIDFGTDVGTDTVAGAATLAATVGGLGFVCAEAVGTLAFAATGRGTAAPLGTIEEGGGGTGGGKLGGRAGFIIPFGNAGGRTLIGLGTTGGEARIALCSSYAIAGTTTFISPFSFTKASSPASCDSKKREWSSNRSRIRMRCSTFPLEQ